jgi:Tfp pilus assembly protein PilP
MLSLLVFSGVRAEENSIAASQRTTETVEKLLRTPPTIEKQLADTGEATKAKLSEAAPTGGNPNDVPPSRNEDKVNPQEKLRASPAGRRDPFRPFTLNVRSNIRPRDNLSPLERSDFGQLKLVGIIQDANEPRAIIEDSAGLGYVVKVGTPIGINDGKVKSIGANAITVEEFFLDLYGARKKRDVEMRLPREKSE